MLQAHNKGFFGAGQVSWNRSTSITLHALQIKEGIYREKFSYFFCEIFLKLNFKWEFNPYMLTNSSRLFNLRLLASLCNLNYLQISAKGKRLDSNMYIYIYIYIYIYTYIYIYIYIHIYNQQRNKQPTSNKMIRAGCK